ncbi:hypothetical protein Pla110_00510 [Polystyrenella longa]|uniref:Uncharacterized protein n=1 Tax=Polystyrenella longa TaxID=2528007 RepID=A0A518CGK4_9PLAN|nr:hypothetical protein [Polystyrenella longa]QDU78350.1 hypothetical protein Pla110_00510 [Polystyrenella longa]
MARKTASRMDLRREAEAAEAQGVTKKKAKKKKATRKKATRKSAKAAVRRRLVWGVFSGSLKEEARFPYDQREAAEEKLEALRARSTKKLFFIQPIKEPIGDETPAAAETETAPEEDDVQDVTPETDEANSDDDSSDDEDLELEDGEGDDADSDDDDDSSDD